MKERIKKADQASETAPQKSHTGRRSETNGKPTEKNNKPKVPKKQFPFVKHQENAKWYDYQINERLGADDSTLPTEKFKEIFDEAHMLLQNDVYLYNQLMRSQGGSEAAWLQTVVSKGTSGDRMTAMQLQITKSPVHGISFISELVRQCEKQNIRQSMETMPLLEKILIDELLPETRKLISFEMRPLARLNEIASGSEQGRKRILVLWMFEHELKKIYASFIKSLELLANGAVETAILRSVKIISNLLAERPEAEAQLLTSLVNKLGHPNYKVGARIAHLLEGVCARQPAMKQVVVTEVERLVYRKNINDRGHLYAATFLSQLPFSRHDPELAVQTEPRLLRILLTASNRAFPFAKAKAESLVSDIDTLYKLMHTSTFTVSLQTLKLLFQVLELSDSFSDRYYSALYRKLF
ncbi:unnamed protein product, partial [Mesorhabditis belari]|uniref:Uncharacterized protein n=1 Tax=Mesorhabditis belari TaxID=2138241 RepID=A0AAF3FNS3_9BILA